MGEILRKAIRQNYGFWICLSISIFLLVGSALCPPYFVIDSSIFAGVGELFAFAALGAFIKAMDLGKDAKISHGNTTIQLGDLSSPESVDKCLEESECHENPEA